MFLERARDKKFWEKVKTEERYRIAREEFLRIYQKDALPPIPVLSFSKIKLFSETGNRFFGEEIYFIRRRALTACAMLALIYPEEPAYLMRLEDFIFAICEEYTWALPAHMTSIEEDIPDDVDLFASETGFALAEIGNLLKDRLSPLVFKCIQKEVVRRIVNPMADEGRTFAWIGFRSNWAAVCGASVAIATYYVAPDRLIEIQPRVDRAMQNFLEGYGDSGFCIEGMSYWWYGFGFFTAYTDLMREITGGAVDGFRSEKIKNIASFAQKMNLSGTACVSFSDAQRTWDVSPGLNAFLTREYPSDVFFPDGLEKGRYCDSEGRWGLAVRSVVWMEEALPPAPAIFTAYAEKEQWLIRRRENFGFAAKGGCNREAHNHNDVGSFLLAAHGEQVFADLGCGEYTKQYFRDETRYDVLQCSSLGHSVPIVGGKGQPFGSRYRAENASFAGETFSFDFASAYGEESGLKSLIRTFTLTDRGVVLTDRAEFSDAPVSITERFVLLKEPQVLEGKFRAGGFTAAYAGAAPKVTPVEITEHDGVTKTPVWLVDFAMEGEAFQLKIEVV